MLVNALGITNEIMPYIFEQPKSPKIGYYVPGTNIQIISDDKIKEIDPSAMIIWSWHIVDEILDYLNQIGYRGQIWIPMPTFRLLRESQE